MDFPESYWGTACLLFWMGHKISITILCQGKSCFMALRRLKAMSYSSHTRECSVASNSPIRAMYVKRPGASCGRPSIRMFAKIKNKSNHSLYVEGWVCLGGVIERDVFNPFQVTSSDGCRTEFERLANSTKRPSHIFVFVAWSTIEPKRRKGAIGLSPCSCRGGNWNPCAASAPWATACW